MRATPAALHGSVHPPGEAGGRTVKRRKGGRENQPSSKFLEKAWHRVPILQNSSLPLRRSSWGKKGETSRRLGSCFTILVAPPVSALDSFWVVSSTSCRDSLLNSANRGPKPSSPTKAPVRNVATRKHRFRYPERFNPQKGRSGREVGGALLDAQLHKTLGVDVDVAPDVFPAHHQRR